MSQFRNIISNNINALMIVDKDLQIVFNSRRLTLAGYGGLLPDTEEFCGRNLFEAYPDIDPNNSTIVQALRSGKVVYRKNQEFIDYRGRYYKTHNVSIPVIQSGNIIGVIELVKDVTTIEDIIEQESSEKGTLSMGEQVGDEPIMRLFTFDDIHTQDFSMLQAIQNAKHFALLENPVLISGETGTGKEMFAQAMIHERGVSPDRIVIQNCAAIPDTLIESILFGSSKGAYTGAEKTIGLFQKSDNGVLFLDELNALPYHVQGKLLRVLQDGSFRPVGSSNEMKVKTKVIATINKDPLEAIEEKSLRSDLFYRLSSCLLHLTPLRERRNDIMYYVNIFLDEMSRQYQKQIHAMTPGLVSQMEQLDWPGNVRELKHAVEAMVSHSKNDQLAIENLPAYLLNHIRKTDDISSLQYHPLKDDLHLPSAIENTERKLIFQALRLTKGNKTQAAELLGIPRQTLNYRLGRLINHSPKP